jgi:hypothetical protein
VTNLGPSNRNKIFARLYGGLSGSALAEFMAPIQLKPYELQYFYAPRLRHLAFERGWVSPLKKMTKCGQRPKTVADNLSNRQHGHRKESRPEYPTSRTRRQSLTRLIIGEALALTTSYRGNGAVSVVAPKRDTVIIAELEFGKVAVQMLLAAMLVDALHPALKNRESDIGRAAA